MFLDDLSMPHMDTYGTQQPIALLKLLLERKVRDAAPWLFLCLAQRPTQLMCVCKVYMWSCHHAAISHRSQIIRDTS